VDGSAAVAEIRKIDVEIVEGVGDGTLSLAERAADSDGALVSREGVGAQFAIAWGGR
jgi:hypothetical protein